MCERARACRGCSGRSIWLSTRDGPRGDHRARRIHECFILFPPFPRVHPYKYTYIYYIICFIVSPVYRRAFYIRAQKRQCYLRRSARVYMRDAAPPHTLHLRNPTSDPQRYRNNIINIKITRPRNEFICSDSGTLCSRCSGEACKCFICVQTVEWRRLIIDLTSEKMARSENTTSRTLPAMFVSTFRDDIRVIIVSKKLCCPGSRGVLPISLLFLISKLNQCKTVTINIGT